MEGMLWASLLLVGMPLGIGLGVAVHLLRRRGAGVETPADADA